jgi:penicillin-insensitive murein endopeptidase
MPPAAVGSAGRGCLAGGDPLPLSGPGFEVMRPSRGRTFGHPDLIAFVHAFARAMQGHGWPGLLVGDLAQARGGPMRSGHASHQSGLDVDIWFLPAPAGTLSRDDREELSAVSMVAEGGKTVDRTRWREGHPLLLRIAAEFPQVDRIFVNPAIKRHLCADVRGDRGWLRKLRPWWGHDHHFHVRLRCPADDRGCEASPPLPDGDGCDASLDWWLSAEAAADALRRGKEPPRRLTLDDLPQECRSVLGAPAAGG